MAFPPPKKKPVKGKKKPVPPGKKVPGKSGAAVDWSQIKFPKKGTPKTKPKGG